MKIDLHLHTTASDGSMTPTQVVDWAKRTGLDLIAITDHDSVSGIDEAIARGKEVGIRVLVGIEISSFSNCEIHVLGYNFDYKNPAFVEELAKIQGMRKVRNGAILRRLKELGLPLSFTEEMDGVGRLNMAKEMVERGYVKDINEAFEKYLGPKGIAYQEIKRTTPMDAVKLIKKYGGIASLAHPKKYLLDKKLDLLVGGLKAHGLDGIEVEYPRYNDHDKAEFTKIARKYNLVTTGGSDFHGDEDKDFQVTPDKNLLRVLKIRY